MLPIGPLMIEHRLIERMVSVLAQELDRIREKHDTNPDLLEAGIDFFRTYADRTHHGKEEDILFRALEEKDLPDDLIKIMNELVQEHGYAREEVGRLAEARGGFRGENDDNIIKIIEILENLTKLYPEHIRKEDKDFFIPVMDYFTAEEKDRMLKQFSEFDERMIHEKYTGVVENFSGK